jgi:hypothetical protein
MRNFQVGEMPSAPGHIVTSLRNWVEGHGSIAQEETEFLDYGHDLFTTVKYADGATSLLKPWIEGIVVRFSDLLGKVFQSLISLLPNFCCLLTKASPLELASLVMNTSIYFQNPCYTRPHVS